MKISFPENFSLGVASAATQIEGGDTNNSWYDWYKKGHIADGSDPSIATRHYEKYQEDSSLMADMGITQYRMGLEWARLEPQRGEFNQEAWDHYRQEIELLKVKGITVLLTLHHFTNPLWFEEMGAFEHPDGIPIFLDFVHKAVTELGDLVAEYITINEPNVYASHGWFFGLWPPGKKSMFRTFRVIKNLCICHIKAYNLIHHIRSQQGFPDTKVSYAHHMRSFVPRNRKNLLHVLTTPLVHRLFQSCISRAFLTGRPTWPIGRMKGIRRGLYCDFHAVNYYTRTAVAGLKDSVLPGVPVNDLGWEIYPEGLAENIQELIALAPLPVYITENGTCDNTDSFRSRYIYEHLAVIVSHGLPVERYYHWCFTDNFEWLEGFSARFGLIHVDYVSQERRLKESAGFYTRMIADGGVSEEAFAHYCKQDYTRKSQEERA